MKKTVSIILIAVLAVTGVIGATAAISKIATKDDTAPTKPTVVSTTAPTTSTEETTAPTQTPTQAPTTAVTQTETTAPESSTKAQTTNTDDEYILPDLRGTWVHENNPNGCSVQVVKQNGNDMEILITSIRGNASQIATSRVNFTLDTFHDGAVVRGTADFNYTDSFGNSGTGSISVSENVITLVINQESSSSAGWSVQNTTGDYLFSSNEINANEYNF